MVKSNPLPVVPDSERSVDSHQAFDIIKVLWRWKWLPLMGAALGTGLGYLHFSKQPTEYVASALVRVVDSFSNSSQNAQAIDPNEVASYGRLDESMVIKSHVVLRKAVEKGRLADQPALRGMNADEIAAMLKGPSLSVQPAAKDVSTTLLSIKYVCNDAELAAAVTNAVVVGYSEYLSEEYRTEGDEDYELLRTAQQKLEEHFKTLYERSEKFRETTSSVIWSGNEATDPYSVIYNQVNSELSALQMELEKLRANLEQVKEGIAAGRPQESLLLMLASANEQNLLDELFRTRDPLKVTRPSMLRRGDSEAVRLENNELWAMELRYKELLEVSGEGHPAVANQLLKIDLMREKIVKTALAEQQEELEMVRLLEEAEREAAEQNGEPIGITTAQRLQIRINALREKGSAIQKQIAGLKVLAETNLQKSQESQGFIRQNKLLNLELESVRKLLETYTEKVKAINLLPQLGQRTLKELELPSIGELYGPNLIPYLLGGGALGVVLMSGLAILMDLADRSYRSPDEISIELGMPVIGHIPAMDVSKIRKLVDSVDESVTTIHHSRGRVSEAYRAVRTGLFFSNRGSDLKLIQVTSPVPGDGKSTLSANLAVTMAQSGRRVVLIDADFRRPRIAAIFGIESEVGMAQVVAGEAELDDATFASCVANLSIMPGGKRPHNPAELLSSRRFRELLELLRDRYDMVIVDTPPLLAVSDPSAVSAIVDGVVLTMRLRRNVKPLAIRATKILESVDAKLLGIVVNGVTAEAGHGYSYSYNDYRYAYRYGSDYRYGSNGKYGEYTAGYLDDNQENQLSEA